MVFFLVATEVADDGVFLLFLVMKDVDVGVDIVVSMLVVKLSCLWHSLELTGALPRREFFFRPTLLFPILT